MPQKGFYRSGEVAALFGISSDTLRYYERMGLLAARRSPNRYREYSSEMVGRIRLIRSALAIGFSVKELRRILKSRDGGGIPCGEVRHLLSEKLKTLKIQIRQMQKMQSELSEVLQDWDKRLKNTGPGKPARLLETLATDGPNHHAQRRKR
jgi:DNA-binding transcriptional MerR regulator